MAKDYQGSWLLMYIYIYIYISLNLYTNSNFFQFKIARRILRTSNAILKPKLIEIITNNIHD